MKNNAFIPENKLEEILIKFTSDKNYKSEFYKIFLDSDVHVLINKKPPEQEKMYLTTEKTEVDFIAKYIANKPCLPIFSSMTRVRNYLGDRQIGCMRINAKDLLESVDPALTVMLNLNSAYGKEFTPLEIKHILVKSEG